jgi:DNA-binding MarR family transcriptional regulator
LHIGGANVVIDNNLLSSETRGSERAMDARALRKAKPEAVTRRQGRAASRAAAAPKSSAKLDLGGLGRHVGYFLRRLQLAIFQDFIRTLEPLDVRPAQYSVLLLIEANPGRSQAAIGQALNIERARLARMLHELERRDWVERRDGDGRTHSLFLTGEGVQALARIKKLAGRHEQQIADLIGVKRRKQLMELLREFG